MGKRGQDAGSVAYYVRERPRTPPISDQMRSPIGQHSSAAVQAATKRPPQGVLLPTGGALGPGALGGLALLGGLAVADELGL